MDERFNLKLRSWLDDDNRTTEEGCLLLLQMEGNQIHYRNLLRYPDKKKLMSYLVSELNQRLTVRLAKVTHSEVVKMEQQAEAIIKNHFAYRETPQNGGSDGTKKGTSDEEFRKGKRDDHDQLPEEIQARYVENLSLLQRMREVHLKLRSMSLEDVSCPDSERYPFLKELIELDKQLHENWDVYDHYVMEADGTSVLVSSPEENDDPETVTEPTSEEEPAPEAELVPTPEPAPEKEPTATGKKKTTKAKSTKTAKAKK